jgi:hypothetical protein
MAEATVWHKEQKTKDCTEYYILIQDGEQTIPCILKYDASKKEVTAEPYTAPDLDYTVHDFCDHENDECVLDDPESPESEDARMADKYNRAIDNLEKQIKHQKVVKKLIADQATQQNREC